MYEEGGREKQRRKNLCQRELARVISCQAESDRLVGIAASI
jgi:hypothetical protein